MYKTESVESYNEIYVGTNVVLAIDNAPAHHWIEMLFPEHDNTVLLCLGPQSPMRNLIEI